MTAYVETHTYIYMYISYIHVRQYIGNVWYVYIHTLWTWFIIIHNTICNVYTVYYWQTVVRTPQAYDSECAKMVSEMDYKTQVKGFAIHGIFSCRNEDWGIGNIPPFLHCLWTWTYSPFHQLTSATLLFCFSSWLIITEIILLLFCCFLLSFCQIAQIKTWTIWFFIILISDLLNIPSFIFCSSFFTIMSSWYFILHIAQLRAYKRIYSQMP